MTKYKFYERNVVFMDRNELDVTMTVSLDEYCPNAVRIVKSDMFPVLSHYTLTENGVEYDGKNIFRIIYVSDYNDTLKSVNFEQDFAGVMKVNAMLPEENLTVEMTAKPVLCSCKILSARQLELKGRVLVSGAVCSEKESELFGEKVQNDKNICMKEETLEICDKIRVNSQRVQIESDITLSNSEPSVGEMLYTEIKPYITRTECHDGKINVFGNIFTRFIYVPEESDDVSEQVQPTLVIRNIPFEEEIYADGVKENSYAVMEAVPIYAKTGVSYDPYGENRLLSLCADIGISASVYECDSVVICTDVFGVGQIITPKILPVSFEKTSDTVNEKIHINEKIHMSPRSFSQVIDSGMNLRVLGTEISDGKLYASLRAEVTNFGVDENKNPISSQSGFNLKVPISTGVNPNEAKADLCVSLGDTKCEVRNGDLIVEANAEIYGVLCEKRTVNAVSDMTCVKDESESEKGHIIVYYPQKNDKVWSVSKSYGVNPEELKRTNGIESEDLSCVKMIVVTK